MNISKVSHESLPGKLLRAPLRLLPKSAVVPIVRGPLRGRRWLVGSSTHGCWLGTYEADKVDRFARFIRPGMIVYDVGAQAGYYTLLASRFVGASGIVFAFEPEPSNINSLRKHVDINGANNVRIVDAAVARNDGFAFFRSQPSRLEGRLDEGGNIRVMTVSLDKVVGGGAPPPDLVKMDIEGGELEALVGAIEILRGPRPTIFLATHSPSIHSACCDLLSEMGYDTEVIGTPDELLARPRVESRKS